MRPVKSRRLAGALLVAALVAALAAGPALADSQVAPAAFSDIGGDPAEYEVTVLAALGILSGDAGLGSTFRPGATITRAEVCKVLVGALGRGNVAQMMQSLKPPFKDADSIPPWAWGWVNTAQQLGLIGGYPDGTFKPNNQVKYSEVVAMLVRSVFGHEQQVKKSTLPWPMNYIAYAVTWGFTGDVVPYGELPATRGDVARMIYATMQVNKVNGEGAELPGTSQLHGRIFTGTLAAYTGTSATIGGTSKPLASRYWLLGASSLGQLLNLEVRAVTDKDGNWVVIRKLGTSTAYQGTFDELTTSGSTTYLAFADGKKIPYRGHVPVTLNGASGRDERDLQEGDSCSVVQGSDGYAASVVAFRYDLGQDYLTAITKSTSTRDTLIELRGGDSFYVPSSCTVTLNGSSSGRDSLAVNDVVRIATVGAAGSTPYRIDATRRTVEGTVAGIRYSSGGTVQVTIQKTTGGSSAYVLDETYCSVPAMGARVKYGLDADNRLFVPLAETVTQPYVLVKEAETGASVFRVTVDCRGETQTYEATFDMAPHIGKYGRLTLTAGKVTAFDHMPLTTTQYEVLSHSSGGMTVRVTGGGSTYYVYDTDVVVYRRSGDTVTYIGCGGVQDGWTLKADATRTIWEYTAP